jgi:hypothetical protein
MARLDIATRPLVKTYHLHQREGGRPVRRRLGLDRTAHSHLEMLDLILDLVDCQGMDIIYVSSIHHAAVVGDNGIFVIIFAHPATAGYRSALRMWQTAAKSVLWTRIRQGWLVSISNSDPQVPVSNLAITTTASSGGVHNFTRTGVAQPFSPSFKRHHLFLLAAKVAIWHY